MHSLRMRAQVAGGFIVALLIAIAMIFTGTVGGTGSGPTPAHARCGGGLDVRGDVVSRFPQNYALQYTRRMKVRVNRGERVRKWSVELYTFSGFLIGKSKADESLGRSEVAKVKLRQAVQPGKYTMVIKGKVPGCGVEEAAEVVRFRSCLGRLPIKAIDKPGGNAADYNGFVSLKVAPKSGFAPLRKIHSTLSSFEGVVFGTAEFPRGFRRLIGEQFLHHELDRDLEPGRYTAFITGKAPQPNSCGDVSKTIRLRFR